MAAANDNATEALLYLETLDRARLAQNTHKGYQADWSLFMRFCQAEGLEPLPCSADTLSLYIAVRLTQPLKVSTVRRHASAVAFIHKRAGLDSPITNRVRELLRAARRLRQEAVDRVTPLGIEDVRAIATALALDDTPTSIRNRSIVLIGFASALRSASLVDLNLEDIELCDKGVTLSIRREKNDKESKGRYIGIPFGQSPDTCPVGALKSWLLRRGSYAGPLFTCCNNGDHLRHLQAEQICRIVQQCLKRIGRDASEYGSHSLRAGFVTSAGECGIGELLIAAQTGHRDMATLRTYFRKTDIWKANASGMIGL